MPDQPINQRIAAKAVIFNDQGAVLILREAITNKEGTQHGRYQVPGGRINPGEHHLQGLGREVLEETGLAVEIGGPVYVGEWGPIIMGVPNQIIAVYFRCRLVDGEVRLSEEHDRFMWVDPLKIADYNLVSPETEAIQAALAVHT